MLKASAAVVVGRGLCARQAASSHTRLSGILFREPSGNNQRRMVVEPAAEPESGPRTKGVYRWVLIRMWNAAVSPCSRGGVVSAVGGIVDRVVATRAI